MKFSFFTVLTLLRKIPPTPEKQLLPPPIEIKSLERFNDESTDNSFYTIFYLFNLLE
jgi:hypothetical protein